MGHDYTIFLLSSPAEKDWATEFSQDLFSDFPGNFFRNQFSMLKPESKQASKPARKQASKEASKQASKPASQQASKQVGKQASQPASQPASKQASQEASQPASKQASKGRQGKGGCIFLGLFFDLFFVFLFVFQPGFVASMAFVGWAFVALPSIYLI